MSDSHSTVEYREVEGFPGYRVGNDGSVWCRRARNGKGPLGEVWRKLRPMTAERGYLAVMLYPGPHRRMVHRLVLEAFVGLRPKGMWCRHFPDQNPSNNRIENISWDTPARNLADKKANGTEQKGEAHGGSKLTSIEVRMIRDEYATGLFTQKQLGAKYGVSQTSVSKILLGKKWAHVV